MKRRRTDDDGEGDDDNDDHDNESYHRRLPGHTHTHTRARPTHLLTRCTAGVPERILSWSPVALFRFSALTYNAHMIHYNEGWATGVERHPGLVVHGPLNLICMLDYFRDMHGREPRAISYRALSPLYAGDEYSVHTAASPAGAKRGEGGRAWEIVVARGAEVCMKGTVLTDG